MRALSLVLLLGLGLWGCGDRYPQGGPCASDNDCVICSPCGCPRVYAVSDVDTASCEDIRKNTTCPSQGDVCNKGETSQGLCVSGHCHSATR